MFCPMTKEPCVDDCAWRLKPYEERDTWPDQCAVNLLGHFIASWQMPSDFDTQDFLLTAWSLMDMVLDRLKPYGEDRELRYQDELGKA